MAAIKIPIEQLQPEPKTSSCCDLYSHPAWTRKIPKGITPCDYDPGEKTMEIETSSGDRKWYKLAAFFGKVIYETEKILLLYPDDSTAELRIVNIGVIKIKRTEYWKLIFELKN